MLLAVIALLAAAGAAVASGGTVIVSCHDAPPGPLPSCELLQGWLDARNAATLLSSLSERLHALGDGIQAVSFCCCNAVRVLFVGVAGCATSTPIGPSRVSDAIFL